MELKASGFTRNLKTKIEIIYTVWVHQCHLLIHIRAIITVCTFNTITFGGGLLSDVLVAAWAVCVVCGMIVPGVFLSFLSAQVK